MEIVDIGTALDCVQAELVGRAVACAATDARTRHPECKVEAVVVATRGIFTLRDGQASELAGPNHER